MLAEDNKHSHLCNHQLFKIAIADFSCTDIIYYPAISCAITYAVDNWCSPKASTVRTPEKRNPKPLINWYDVTTLYFCNALGY
jgi:hypothetical protein